MSRVLVIEDYEDNATLFERVLKSRGHTVLSAPDGETGLKMAVEHRPDLILLDLGLPDIDGQTVASQIRRTPEVARVPILVVTAWPADTARKMIEVYGCNGYLRKPIEIAQLIASVDSLLAGSAC
jgi:two-component system cell cycle response regulator DivK